MKTRKRKGLQIKPYTPLAHTFLGFHLSQNEEHEKRTEMERRHHEHQVEIQKRESEALVGNLSQTISKFNQSLMPPHPQWPTDTTLSDVKFQVDMICRSLGRQDTRFFWENCAFVEERKSKLRVQKCISNLVDRAVAVEERPLHKFLVAANQKEENSEVAKELIAILSKLRGRTLEVKKVDWIKFKPLFLQSGTPVVETNLKNAAASQDYQCYTKCLEILLDDLSWSRRHAEGSMQMLSWVARAFPKAHPIFKKMQRFNVFPGSAEYAVPSTIDHVLEHKEERKSALARARKRAERSRKIGKTA